MVERCLAFLFPSMKRIRLFPDVTSLGASGWTIQTAAVSRTRTCRRATTHDKASGVAFPGTLSEQLSATVGSSSCLHRDCHFASALRHVPFVFSVSTSTFLLTFSHSFVWFSPLSYTCIHLLYILLLSCHPILSFNSTCFSLSNATFRTFPSATSRHDY